MRLESLYKCRYINFIISHSGIANTTGFDSGPFPSTLVANTVVETPLLENRQGEVGVILSVCVHIRPMQADAGIVSVPQI